MVDCCVLLGLSPCSTRIHAAAPLFFVPRARFAVQFWHFWNFDIHGIRNFVRLFVHSISQRTPCVFSSSLLISPQWQITSSSSCPLSFFSSRRSQCHISIHRHGIISYSHSLLSVSMEALSKDCDDDPERLKKVLRSCVRVPFTGGKVCAPNLPPDCTVVSSLLG
jgi:hypothetical protein